MTASFSQETKAKKPKFGKGFLTPVRNGNDGKKNKSNWLTLVNKTSPSVSEKVTNSVNRAQMALKKFSAEVSNKGRF